MMIDDIRFVDTSHGSLPEGWVIVDNQFELDETWIASAIRGQRRGEINQRELNVSQREQIIEAKKKELQSYFKNAVWEFGYDSKGSFPHDRVVTARWVLTWKPPQPGSDVPRAKARLVLRGYQDPDLFNLEKNSPTAGRSGKLVLLTLAAILKWLVWCGDVKAAFLSGAKFSRELLVQLPRDCGPLLGYTSQQPVHMRMLKSAYGLADAPLLWFKEATRRLRNLKLVHLRLLQRHR